MNIGRNQLAGVGTSSSALSFCGTTTIAVATTEVYNSVVWAVTLNRNTAITALAGAGTALSALSFGGATVATTELFTNTPSTFNLTP
jgi:hypothetical protein